MLYWSGNLVIIAECNMKISSRNSGAKPGGSAGWFWVIALFHLGKYYVLRDLATLTNYVKNRRVNLKNRKSIPCMDTPVLQ